jgi:hypothetical protein
MDMPTLERTFVDPQATVPAYSNLALNRLQFAQVAQLRLQHLAAVLNSAGIGDLSSAGKLSLEGNLLPSAGVTKPNLPNPFGQPQPFQSAYIAHPGGAPSLVRTGGTAKPVSAVPLPSLRMDVPADVVLPVNTAYWAASWIELADNTTVVIQYPVAALVIIAEKITIGNNVTFTWQRPILANLPGKPAKPAKPASAATAVSNDKPPPGTPGRPGTNGDPSGVHRKGTDAPQLEIWTLDMSGHPIFDLRGQDGFEGAPGGDGGDGGDGAPGKPDAKDGWGFCKSGPGDGGDGGAGGRAGDGGPGGDGGSCGKLTVYAPQATLDSFAQSISANLDGGAPGPGGIPGVPGAGGGGGPRGDNSNGCKPATPRNAGSAGPQGGPGNPGPNGKSGLEQVGALSLCQIDAGAFETEFDKPGIAIVAPSHAKCGVAVEVTGKGFKPTDKVTIGGIACAATIASDTTLQFVLPLISGGMQFIQVLQSDGATSNPASIYIEPALSISLATRHVPGEKVDLEGTGFRLGMQVQVNGQDMPGVTVLGPSAVEFQLVRPASVVANPSGETVGVRVVLPDAGPWSGSNNINLTLDTFRILVFGDSVMWGQGLEEPNKFHSLVEQAIRQRHGDIGVYKDVRAHSGAMLSAKLASPISRLGGTAFQQRLNGEIPTDFPLISDQILEFENAPDAQDDMDLILLDGGINDINVRTILSPLTSSGELSAGAKIACHDDMVELLKELVSKFSKAKIIVTGYYQVISNQSDLALLDALMIAVGLDLASIPGAIIGGLATAEIRDRISANCALFASEANRQLQNAVAEVNAALPGSVGTRAFFADPKFGPANAALAPDSFVYGIHIDLSPEDPTSVAGPRAAACDAAGSGQTDVAICKRASVGHPNARGAQAYANAIMPLL